MCGRFAFNFTWAEIHALLELTTPLDQPPDFIAPRYNAAPTQSLPVALDTDGRRILRLMRWGLVPSWAKHRAIGNRLINARSETARDKPAFRHAFARRRCLVPASGFYEWKRPEPTPERKAARKQPYFIQLLDASPFAMAGMWEQHVDPDGERLTTFTILTTVPNELVAPLHDRMPVILHPGAYDRWLDPGEHDTDALTAMLVPYPAQRMRAHPVSTRVNSPANDDPVCLAPLERPAPGTGPPTGLFPGD